jgi:hypothetical protein
MGKLTFNVGEGGLGRDLPSKDNYSGFIFDDASKPVGWGTESVKKVRTLKEAEDLGLTSALFPVAHYQVSEFFRIAQKLTTLAQGHLWIMFFDGGVESANYDGTQLVTLQNKAEGEIRRAGVFLTGNYASGFITDSQTQADVLATANKPLSVLLNADVSALTLATLTDLRALSSPRVSFNIGMDKGGTGGALFISEGYTVSNLGAALAAKAFGETHENIGWIGKFDQSSDAELNTIQFGTGEDFESQTQTTLDDVNDKGYLYLKKEVGVTGSFQQDAPTATAATSDFAYWENQEVIDKAIREVRKNLLPLVNSPLYVATDTGELSESTIQVFRTEAFSALDKLARDGNISTKASGELDQNSVIIDPAQDVLATSEIVVTIRIVPVGVARAITVNIGFTTQI